MTYHNVHWLVARRPSTSTTPESSTLERTVSNRLRVRVVRRRASRRRALGSVYSTGPFRTPAEEYSSYE
eukprot:scaffold453466_cov14-Prasinocladus_malaysianus.AAC.1